MFDKFKEGPQEFKAQLCILIVKGGVFDLVVHLLLYKKLSLVAHTCPHAISRLVKEMSCV